jgi:ACT domain-containing protein
MINMSGKTHLVYLTEDLFDIAETVRKQLGLSRSGFYRYCVLKTLDSMSVLSAKAKQGLTREEANAE